MLARGRFLKTAFEVATKVLNPLVGALFQFGVIFVLPTAGRAVQRFQLAQSQEFPFRCLNQKEAPSALAYDHVNLRSQLFRNNDVSAFVDVRIARHTLS
jgi:hypothetical protein